MRWPLMTKARAERELHIHLEYAQALINSEYNKALQDGKKQVREWARDANANIMTAASPAGAAQAAFRYAEAMFNPKPSSFQEVIDSGVLNLKSVKVEK